MSEQHLVAANLPTAQLHFYDPKRPWRSALNAFLMASGVMYLLLLVFTWWQTGNPFSFFGGSRPLWFDIGLGAMGLTIWLIGRLRSQRIQKKTTGEQK